jgi:archaeosine synthase beta-subunit
MQHLELNSSSYLKSESRLLPGTRKEEIVNRIISAIPKLKQHRKAHLRKLNILREKSREFADKSLPAWVRVSTTESESGYRLIVGFRNNTCVYRVHDPLGLGCLNCGYYAGTGEEKEATPTQLIKQLDEGLTQGFNYEQKFDVIEFLSDGSFLGDDEYDRGAKDKIVELLSSTLHIKRILVESRPEYVINRQDEIEKYLKCLRRDQTLEIGIGLETADDFIRQVCINKGFGFGVFEHAVKKVSQINRVHNDRCAVVAYILIKPAFLSTKETILDVIGTLQVLSDLSEKYRVKIIPKLEPAAISDGTILSLLYSQNEYTPLNYWAVLEIITFNFLDSRCKGVSNNIRVGAREDMDDVLKVPAIYTGNQYDQYDFIVYNVIQQFNQDHDLFKLYAIIESTFPGGLHGLLDANSSLMNWLKDSYSMKNSSIIGFINKYSDKINTNANVLATQLEAKFLKNIYSVLNRIEGYDHDRTIVGGIMEIIDGKEYPFDMDIKRKIGELIFTCFQKQENSRYIKVLDIVKEPDGFLRIFFEMRDFLSRRKFSLWVEVPTHERPLI